MWRRSNMRANCSPQSSSHASHRRPLLTGLLFVPFCVSCGALALADAPASRLAVIQPAPSFTLTTQSGTTLRSDHLKGKVLLVSFIFTTCNGSCPATTHRMADVQKELARRGLLKKQQVQLLSISLDPARDTPEVLHNYMKVYD